MDLRAQQAGDFLVPALVPAPAPTPASAPVKWKFAGHLNLCDDNPPSAGLHEVIISIMGNSRNSRTIPKSTFFGIKSLFFRGEWKKNIH